VAYPEDVIQQARAEYETGNFSVSDLPVRKKFGMSARVIEKWITRWGWEKGKLRPQIEERKANAMIEAFSAAGMKTEEAISLTVSGMRAGEDVARRIVEELKATGGAPTEAAEDMVKAYLTDLRTRQKYLAMYFEITGQVAPQVVEASLQPKRAFDLSKLSDDELRVFMALREKCE